MNSRTGMAIVVFPLVAFFGFLVASEKKPPMPQPNGENQKAKVEPVAALAEADDDKDPAQGIRKAADAYAAAFNKGDLTTLMTFWTADADFINEQGKVYKGKAAISELFKASMEKFKGHTLKLHTKSIRVLKPDVVLEDGTVELTTAEGTPDVGRFSAIWIKQDGKWLLSSVRDLPDNKDASEVAPYDYLKSLEWMAGEWNVHNEKGDATLKCYWTAQRSFLVQEFHVKRSDGKAFVVEQRIGWDPQQELIRSWIFDTMGGFGEGYWSREGNKWTVEIGGTLPDGRTGSSVNSWQFVDEKTLIWKAFDRSVDEHPLPDVELKFAKKVASK